MKVDIVIPVKEINSYIRESIPYILNLEYRDFEIIILPDADTGEAFPKTKIIPTGNIGPAEKRDLALRYSKADILAFIDDDAYPRQDWLKNAVRHFDEALIAAVGGPAITPDTDSFWQRASGAVFLSRLSGGNPERYCSIGQVKEVDDWPSVNLLVRRSIFEEIGGFDSAYWPGEDTKLCLEIVKRGRKIIYDPDVVVWHHRRSGLRKHLRQIGRYGLHRGFFAKKFPETSLRLKYFIPSIWTLFLLLGLPLALHKIPLAQAAVSVGLCFYLIAISIALVQIVSRERNLLISVAGLLYIPPTHVWYGIRFLQGFLFTSKLKSKLRA